MTVSALSGKVAPATAEVLIRRDHQYKTRGRSKSGKRLPGCGKVLEGGDECRQARSAPVHLGVPPSLNVFGSGGDRHGYQGLKKAWTAAVKELLEASGLPKGLERVEVTAAMCFPDSNERDQGNFRYFIEKVLGDTLKTGGWIEDDTWHIYEFGQVAYNYERGVSWTRLYIWGWPKPGASGDSEPVLGSSVDVEIG